MESSIEYYDKNAKDFFDRTVGVDLALQRDRFVDGLPEGVLILDLGCGSGRDSKEFVEMGYRVEAVDASKEMCKLASGYTGLEVRNIGFDEIEDIDRYDGIWACASLLHIPLGRLVPLLNRLAVSLKDGGVMYASFKLGDFEGERDGRHFTDMNQERLEWVLTQTPKLSLKESWVTGDARVGRGSEKWLNIILKKRT